MRFLLATAVIISFALLSQGAFAAVGASPASVVFESMLRSGYAERYITVSNPVDEDATISIGVDGPLGGWLTFEPANFNITGKAYRIIKIIANPPDNAPNGVYYSNILVVSRPRALNVLGGNAVSVASVVSLITAVEVSDQQIIRYKVENMNVPDTEECRPILININLRNTGNVNVTPSFKVNILSADTGQTIQTYDYTSGKVLPTQASSVTVRVPYNIKQYSCIPEGPYTASVRSYAGTSVMDTSNIAFRIYKRGTLTLGGEILELKVPKNVTLGEVVKIDAIFKNTGQLPVSAKLKAEIYEGGRLVSTPSSDPREVMNGGVDTLTTYFTPSGGGKYKILASATFEDKSSDIKEANFEVFWPMTYFAIFGTVAAVVIAAAVLFFLKRGRPTKRKGK